MCIVEYNVCVFFFQAEDGIRDLYVTGVQTCALPISGVTVSASTLGTGDVLVFDGAAETLSNFGVSAGAGADVVSAGGGNDWLTRSEERRVGKECSVRWWPHR